MSKLVSISLLLLFLSVLVSAYPYVKVPGVLYEIQYSILSNGTDALIPVSVYQYDLLYYPNNSLARFGKWHYLLYYNGSQLYLLNFTYVLARPPEVAFVNGSWYLNITTYTYTGTDSTIYRLNPENFSVVRVSTNWLELLIESRIVDELNGWRIIVPEEFKSVNSSIPTADIVVANTEKNAKLYGGRLVLTNSSEFPIYFLLKRGSKTRNVTLLYINTTLTSWTEYGSRRVVGIAGFWFPDSVRVVEIGLSNGSQVPPWEITILNARYSVVSSGKDAIIYLFMATFVPYCPPLLVAGGYNCSNTLTIVGENEYLFYYNDSRLYLLNLTGAINTPGASLESYNGAVFVNGSWYINVTIFNRNTEKDENRIYLFNPNEFCIKPLNVSWSALIGKAKIVNSINWWKIVIPFEKSPEKGGRQAFTRSAPLHLRRPNGWTIHVRA